MNKLLRTTGRYSAFSVFIKSVLLGLAVILYAGNELRAQTWTPVGAENDISAVASNHSSVTTVQVLVNGVSVAIPYVLYMESSVIKIKRYVNGSWEPVVGNVSDGTADHPYIFSDPTGKLYVSYVDLLNAGKLAVKTFNNGQWEALGGILHVSTGSAAWNGNTNQNGNLHWMAFDSNNIPHVIHHDQGASFLPYVKRFVNGAWEQVGTGSVAAGQSSGLGLAIDQTDNTIFASFTAAGGASTGLPNIATLPPSGGAWVLIGAPIPATNAGRLAAIALDGDNNPILGYANSGSSGRISAFKYDRATQTWGARQVLGTGATFAGVRMTRSLSGDVYVTGIDGSTPKVWRLITGATTWEQLWDGTNQIDVGYGDGRTSIAIGADNKQYLVHVRANTAATPVNTPRLKIFQAPVSITYPGSNAVCAGGSLQLTSSASSGNQWYKEGVTIPDATERTYTVTSAGHYTVKVGTTITSNTVKITVSTPPIATITPGGALTTGVVLSANTGTGYTYQWTQDGSDISGATSANYTTTSAGSYRVKVISGACITTSDASVVVDATTAPTISYSGTTTFCDGGNLVLTSSASTGNQWYKDGVAITGETGTTYTATTSGTYTVTANGSSASTGVSVTVNPSPTATVTPNGPLATGVVLSANTGSGYTYQWEKDGVDISGATSSDYTTTASGSYLVKITLGSCTATSAASVVSNSIPVPTISYTGSTTFCEGQNLVLTSSASSGNQWNKDGVAIPNETSSTYSVIAAGSYTVTTGPTTSTAVNVVVNPNPTATVTASGSLVLARGGSVVLTANAGTGYTFQWTKDGADINAAINADYTATTGGSYRVKVTSSGCITISDASVVSAATTITYTGSTTFCQGGSLVLTSSASSGNQWYKDGVAIANATGSTYTVSTSGSYTVSASTTSTAVNVVVNPAPTAAVTANGSLVIATGGNVLLTANTGTGYTYLWTKDGADINTATNANYTATTAGSYRVKVTSGGCTTLSDAWVVTAAPTISYTGPTTFCQGGNLVLASSASSGNQWYKGGVAISNATSSTYTVTASGTYTVNTGSTHSTAVNISVNPIPTATISANGPLQFTQGGSVVLSANTGTGYTYQWTKDGTDINAATNANYTATTPGLYRVKVSQGGCTGVSSASTIIYIPTISYSGATTMCQGQTVILTSSASSGNQWFKDGESITSANGTSYTAGSSGTYSVTAQGSSASIGVNVTVNPLPESVITAQGSVLFKTGGSVILSGSTGSGYTYKWFRNGTEINGAADATYTATQSGSYTLVTSANSCSVTSSTVEVSSVFALPSTNFSVSVTGESCKTSNDGKILVTAAQNLSYTATLNNNGTATAFPFTSSLQIPNLSAGTYSLCISVDGQTNFSQCYDNLVVVEPNDLSLYSSVNESDQTITLSLNGGKNYNIKINEINHTTTKSSITLPLSIGDNKIVVTADRECQGVVEKLVTLNDKVLIYPNPFDDILSLKLDNERSSKASIQIKSLIGTLVYSKNFTSTDNINLELSHLSTGVYLLKLSLDNSDSFFKVIKR